MEMKDRSYIAFLIGLLVISIAQNGKEASLYSEARLDNIRDIMLVCFGVKIGKVLARSVLMLSKVIIGTVGYAPKFAPSEGEKEFKVGSCL